MKWSVENPKAIAKMCRNRKEAAATDELFVVLEKKAPQDMRPLVLELPIVARICSERKNVSFLIRL